MVKMYDIEHSQDSETRRVNESDDVKRRKRTLDDDRPIASIRILERKYSLTNTGYKFLNVCVTLERSSRVNIILGDSHGKEVSMSPDTWRQLVEQRHVLSKSAEYQRRTVLSCPVAYWKYDRAFRKNQQLDITPGNIRGSLGHVEGNSE
ncbi:hypothetical protein P5V15_001394 [Pogonomyrmex californicus]